MNKSKTKKLPELKFRIEEEKHYDKTSYFYPQFYKDKKWYYIYKCFSGFSSQTDKPSTKYVFIKTKKDAEQLIREYVHWLLNYKELKPKIIYHEVD